MTTHARSASGRTNDARPDREYALVAGLYVAALVVPAAVVALSGGLIGEEIDADDYEGDLERTPAFVGCSDVDPHIPVERVHVTAEVLDGLGADLEKRIYEGMGHGVNDDEVEYVSGMVADLLE